MKTASPNAMVKYTCGACWNSFEHLSGSVMPSCPQCRNNRHVTRAASRPTHWLLLALPIAFALAFGLWSRFSGHP